MNRLLGTSHPEDDVASLRSAFGNLPRVSEPFTSAEHHHYNLILVRNAYALWQSHFDRLTAACLPYSLSDLHKFTHGVFCELDGHRVLSISNADISALASVSIGATGRRVKPEPLRRPETSRRDAVCAQHVPEHQSVTSQEGDSPLVFRACELDGRRLRYKETKAPKSTRIPGPYGAEHRVRTGDLRLGKATRPGHHPSPTLTNGHQPIPISRVAYRLRRRSITNDPQACTTFVFHRLSRMGPRRSTSPKSRFSSVGRRTPSGRPAHGVSLRTSATISTPTAFLARPLPRSTRSGHDRDCDTSASAGDGPANGRERRAIVEFHRRPPQRDPQPEKKRVEIHFDGPGTHLRVQLFEHLRSHCAVADLQRALQRPAIRDAPSTRHKRPKRVLESEAVAGPLPDLGVGEQPEQRAAPVGAAPGVRLIESLVASLGEPLRQSAHEVPPHLLRAQLTGPRAHDRLDVGGETFLRPKMTAPQRGKPEMDQLVYELPARVRLGKINFRAEQEEDRCASDAAGAAVDLMPRRRQDQQKRAVDREAPEVARDEHRAASNPAEQF